MKANELMIGDWVFVPQSNGEIPEQIEGIYRGNIFYASGYECGLYEVEPILLTEEILKCNGIDYESEVGIIKKIGGNIHIRGWKANCELYLGMIRYVHELQHALRLCGLNELADNFKLTTTR